jgi:hypothetical protein
MYNSLFKLVLGVTVAAGTYILANETVKCLTGKHIHQHAYDYLRWQFPEFFNMIKTWCQTTTDWASVQLQLIVDDTKVITRNLLRAVGVLKNPKQQPVVITEKYITPEHAIELGFSTEENQYIELFN